MFSGVCYPLFFFFFFFFFLAKKISEGMDTMMDSILCYRWIVKFYGFFFFFSLKKINVCRSEGMEEMIIE